MNGLLTPQPIRIVQAYDDGTDARHFTFEPLDGTLIQPAIPGQFFNLTVPGQGEAAFTYLTLPNSEGRFSALIRRAGSLTGKLFECHEGDLLGYRGPFGDGTWPLDGLKGKRVLAIAGGCGLAPLACAIDRLQAAGSPIALIYGSRDPANQNLRHERVLWKQQIPLIETFDLPSDKSQRAGTPLDHVNDILEELGGEAEAIITCGPEVMMNAVADYFLKQGLGGDDLHLALERRMHCGVGLCGHCYLGSSYVCVDGPIYSWSELAKCSAATTAN
jgi:anaerobic sulfite reductase subunit B